MNEEEINESEANEGEGLYEKLVVEITRGQEPLRIDKFLMARIEGATRNKIQQGIDTGLVLVNDCPVKPNYKVKPFDKITVYDIKDPESTDIVPEQMALNIAYEDDDIIIINKPAGMVVHPGSGNHSGTLLNGIAWYLKQQNPNIEETELPRFGMVHRIDKNTSGLIVLAKSAKAMTDVAKQFFNHTVHRRYIALVWGDFDNEEGTITGHVGRHQRFRKLFTTYPDGEHGKEAITHYKVLERFKPNLWVHLLQ